MADTPVEFLRARVVEARAARDAEMREWDTVIAGITRAIADAGAPAQSRPDARRISLRSLVREFVSSPRSPFNAHHVIAYVRQTLPGANPNSVRAELCYVSRAGLIRRREDWLWEVVDPHPLPCAAQAGEEG